ncbi:unnamed protein product, partial [Mesorhabditis belari]|uniref:Uncharacterized protein n=1 Tax=Mesorhabditis belari TaxID=2138241 RepID=A0AAF3EBR0_9BILA
MSEVELEKLLDDCRRLNTKFKESDAFVVELMGMSTKVTQKQRMIFNHKWFLDDIFMDNDDGTQRRRLLDEFNDEYYKTELFIERNAILTDNLTECLEVVNEIQERNRILVETCKSESAFVEKANIGFASEENFGYEHAEIKDTMRKIADYVENVLASGEAEMRIYFEQYARDITYVKGIKEAIRPTQLAHFNKLSAEGRSVIFPLLSNEMHFKEDDAISQPSSLEVTQFEVTEPVLDLESSDDDEHNEHNQTVESIIYVPDKKNC